LQEKPYYERNKQNKQNKTKQKQIEITTETIWRLYGGKFESNKINIKEKQTGSFQVRFRISATLQLGIEPGTRRKDTWFIKNLNIIRNIKQNKITSKYINDYY